MRLTADQIEAGRSPAGGWTRKQLAAWGIPWPPPKGWQRALMGKDVPKWSTPRRTTIKLKTCAADFPNLPFAKYYFKKPFAAHRDNDAC